MFKAYINYKSRENLAGILNRLIERLDSDFDKDLEKQIFGESEEFAVDFDNGEMRIHIANEPVFEYRGKLFSCYVEYEADPKPLEDIEFWLSRVEGVYNLNDEDA